MTNHTTLITLQKFSILFYYFTYQVDDSRLYYTELVMDTRPLMGPMGQAYLKSDEYGKRPCPNAWTFVPLPSALCLHFVME